MQYDKRLDEASARFTLTIAVPFCLFVVLCALLTAAGIPFVPTMLVGVLAVLAYMIGFILSDM
jgi:fatty acid desaturase